MNNLIAQLTPSSWYTLVIGTLVSLVLIIIGIVQIKSKNPVKFYTGEEAPTENKLKSVRGWNVSHGLLWIGYGVIIIVCILCAVFWNGDSLIKALVLLGGMIAPTFLMVLGHTLLIKKYIL